MRALLALAMVSCPAPSLAQTHSSGSWPEEIERFRETRAASLPLGPAPGVRTPSVGTLVESEPNPVPSLADSAALGVDAVGSIDPESDLDTWYLDLPAGILLSVDVDAESLGSPLDPVIALVGPDSATVLAFDNDADGRDSRISFPIPESGRYFVAIRSVGHVGAPDFTYVIHFTSVGCAAVGSEREPDGTPGTASPLGTDGSGTGELCPGERNPAGDVDFWAFAARAGTTLELDIDATEPGPPGGVFVGGDPFLELFASDGITRLAFNDDADGRDSRLQFSVVTTGTYYAAVSTRAEAGWNPLEYALHVRTVAAGPGDPVAVRAQGLSTPFGLAVGSTGDLFVGELTGNRVVRISGEGVVTTFAAGIQVPLGIAFDAFGYLLVVSQDGIVYRVDPSGRARPFITDAESPFWIAVARDGRIWITNVADGSLRRYGPTGRFEARFDAKGIGGLGPGPLSVGPGGDPFFSNGTEIWRLANGRIERVLGDTTLIRAFTFDVAGDTYAPTPATGRIVRFDAAGRSSSDPFAVGPDAPMAVAFGRDGAGATVARLFATDPNAGTVIELNPTGIPYPGLPAGRPTPLFAPGTAAGDLLGAGGLSDDDRRLLDALGNHNGRYDAGDLRAYLGAIEPPSDTTTTAARPQGRLR